MQRFLNGALGAVFGLAVGSAACAQPAKDNPYMSFGDEIHWTVSYELLMGRYGGSPTGGFEWDGMTLVAPAIAASGSHLLEENGVRSELTIDTIKIASGAPGTLPSFEHLEEPSGGGFWANAGGYAVWRLPAGVGTSLRSTTTTRIRCYSTEFNESLASQLDWPTKGWPAEVQSTFAPQLYVSLGPEQPYDMAPVKELLAKYTSGQDPKSIKPLALAKWITDRVLTTFQIDAGQPEAIRQSYGEFLVNQRFAMNDGMVMISDLPGPSGFGVSGAPDAALRMRGTRYDLGVLLVALFREAGLPARLVVGWDVGENLVQRAPERRPGEEEGAFVCWLEFCLYDESLDITTWVPVDFEKLQDNSSRRNLERPWEFFGSHEYLNSLVPLSFDLHPAAMVSSFGAPCLGGFASVPGASQLRGLGSGRIYQNIEAEAQERSKRGRTTLPGPRGKDRD